MSFEPPSSSETMWSISIERPYDPAASPYSRSTACFSDCGTRRTALVLKLDEQMTGFVSLVA